MKMFARSAAAKNERNARFFFTQDKATDSRSLQVWEDENPEYASWKLSEDREESASNLRLLTSRSSRWRIYQKSFTD